MHLKPLLYSSLVLAAFATPLTAGEIDWASDLDYSIAAIEAIHPNPHHRIERSELRRRATELRRTIGRLTDAEAAIQLAGLVAKLGDGHTGLDLRGVVDFERWLPIRLRRFPEGVGVTAAGPEYAALLGKRLTQIDGRPAIEVWNLVESFSVGDNVHSKMANTSLFMSAPGFLAAVGIGKSDSIEVTWEEPSTGRQQTVRIKAIESEGAQWYFATSGPAGGGVSLPSTRATPDLPFRNLTSAYTTTLEPSGLLYARIDQIGNTDNPVILNEEERKASLAELYRHLFEILDSDLADTLVIDLSRNAGGNNNLAIPLVEGILARPELNRKGKLFVITSGTTFSAAMNLVSMLESRTEAIFVGQAPGGSPLHYGDARPVTLPSSRLQLRISTLHWDLGVSPWDVRDVMEVDIPAPMTLEALIDGRAPALDAIRSYVDGDILSDALLRVHRSDGLDKALELATIARRESDPRWSPVTQQLLDFGWKIVGEGGSGEDIYRTFRSVADLYPEDFYPWFVLGRINLWPGNWTEAHAAFARARALRPSNDTIRRMTELAARKIEVRPD